MQPVIAVDDALNHPDTPDMTPVADTLWRWIETYLMKDQTAWDNKLDYGTTVDEDDMDSMVTDKFGKYSKYKWFSIGSNRYKMKALPLQNKNNRAQHAYGQVRGGGENKVNILCFKDGENEVGFNLHIQVRRLAAALEARQRQANREAAANDDWQVATGRR